MRSIPFRSKSSSNQINQFCRETTETLGNLFKTCHELQGQLELLRKIINIQGMAVTTKVGELKTTLTEPKPNGEGYEQYLSTDIFSALTGGESSIVFNKLSFLTDEGEPRLFVMTRTGSVLIPSSLKIETTKLPGLIYEKTPQNAISGLTPWYQQAPGVGAPGRITYTVHFPVNILDDTSFNRVDIVPFPIYGVVVESVEYRNGNQWHSLYEGEEDGPVRVSKLTNGVALRVTLRQDSPLLTDDGMMFYIGLNRLDVRKVTATFPEANFAANVTLSGEGAWRIDGCLPDPDLPVKNYKVYFESDEKILQGDNFPLIVNNPKLNIFVKLKADTQEQFPDLKGLTLSYTPNVE